MMSASHISLMSYVYDAPDVQTLLVKRLQRSELKLQVYVDREQFAKRTLARQRPRLKELQDNGAEVYTGRGLNQFGALHAKVAIIDRRVAYAGSENCTFKASNNFGFVFRLEGEPVIQMDAAIAQYRSASSTRLLHKLRRAKQ